VDDAHVLAESAVDPDFLRSLFLFEALNAQQLATLAASSVVVDTEPGLVFAEGDRAQFFFVLVDGELSLTRRVGDRDVETLRATHRGSYCGATAAFIESPPEHYTFSARACGPCRLLRIDAEAFGTFVRVNFPMPVHFLQGMMVDHEGVHQIVDQQHRIQAAGTISAGLMHGLNNPAGAIARTVTQLRTRICQDRSQNVCGRLSPASAAIYDRLLRDASVVGTVISHSALDVAAREERIEDWLAARGIDKPWTLSPALGSAGLDVEWLQEAAAAFESIGAAGDVAAVIVAVADRAETLLLLDELAGASAEVSALVGSARQYSQLDSSPMVVADVNDLLDSTLTVMSAAIVAKGISVRTEYAPDLPTLLCYAGELNQAWTNIVDNAIYAIGATHGDGGQITVRTGWVDDSIIQVELCDNGIGIAPDVRDRIFLPFFTTKPVGEGAGMGLDLAWRVIVGKHGGMLSASSVPGDTRFTACIPVEHPTQQPSPWP
jgi:signal transduction histidine kinase